MNWGLLQFGSCGSFGLHMNYQQFRKIYRPDVRINKYFYDHSFFSGISQGGFDYLHETAITLVTLSFHNKRTTFFPSK